MNRKNNPYISLIALLALILIIVTVCTGCKITAYTGDKAEAEAEVVAETQNRFTVEFVDINLRIITDNETGVQYLAYGSSQGMGLTKLEVSADE